MLGWPMLVICRAAHFDYSGPLTKYRYVARKGLDAIEAIFGLIMQLVDV
jgi:hypothetical protein